MDRVSSNKCCTCRVLGDGAIGCGTLLQAGRSRVLFVLVSLESLIDLILLMALGSTEPLKKMSTGRCIGLISLSPSCVDCLEMWGSSTFWSVKGLFRPMIE